MRVGPGERTQGPHRPCGEDEGENEGENEGEDEDENEGEDKSLMKVNPLCPAVRAIAV